METWAAVIGFLLVGGLLIAISFFAQNALKRREEIRLLDTGQRRHKRNTTVLWGLILLAVAYISLLRYLRTLTGFNMLDGSIGLVHSPMAGTELAGSAGRMDGHFHRGHSACWLTIKDKMSMNDY